MRLKLLIITLSLSMLGCNTFKRLMMQPEHSEPNKQTLPDDYTLSGITHGDYDVISPVRVTDSTIIIKVLQVGTTTWRTCNRYEAFTSTGNSLGGNVKFSEQFDLVNTGFGSMYQARHVPVAPMGTQYEIRSVLADTKSSHELY